MRGRQGSHRRPRSRPSFKSAAGAAAPRFSGRWGGLVAGVGEAGGLGPCSTQDTLSVTLGTAWGSAGAPLLAALKPHWEGAQFWLNESILQLHSDGLWAPGTSSARTDDSKEGGSAGFAQRAAGQVPALSWALGHVSNIIVKLISSVKWADNGRPPCRVVRGLEK